MLSQAQAQQCGPFILFIVGVLGKLITTTVDKIFGGNIVTHLIKWHL